MQTDLWNYCLDLYARPGVEPACLSLQSQGMDVCLLLCAAWLQARAVACCDTRLEQLKSCAGPWQREVVQPLRQLRTQWRNEAAHDQGLAALRVQIKALELEAERELLRRLELITKEWSSTQTQKDCNWLGRVMSRTDHPDCGALQQLRTAINRA